MDLENKENEEKVRFCLVGLGDKAYAFSTKPNVYKKLSSEELETLKGYATINESQRPSDFVLALCDRGNALPLVFHPLGSKFLNDRAAQIDNSLSPEERRQKELELAAAIEATDRPVTSITIPYENGDKAYLYINKNKEFAVRETKKNKEQTTIYHYNENDDTFTQEVIPDEQERE